VVRRFCGKGPVACASKMSPEGSPNFVQTLIGKLASNVKVPCPALDGNASNANGILKGHCCRAVEKISGRENTLYTLRFGVNSQVWQDTLVKAAWNSKTTLQDLKALQGAKVLVHLPDVDLCKPAPAGAFDKAVVIARRNSSSCLFEEKALYGQKAGAIAVIVANIPGGSLPPLIAFSGKNEEPAIPMWMLSNTTLGNELIDAVQAFMSGTLISVGRETSADSSALADLCCHDACRERVVSAAAQRLVPDTVGICPLVECSSYVVPGSVVPAPPHASNACSACGAGLASTVAGLANCAPCADGRVANAGGNRCDPCPKGSAGTKGQCTPCPSGKAPDASRLQCTVGVPSPGTGPAPAAGPSPTPAPGPPPTTQPPFQYAASGTAGTGTAAVEEDGGIPWGPILGGLCACLGIGGLIWFGRMMYNRHGDHFSEGGGLGGIAAMFGKGDKDDEEKGEGEGKAKRDSDDASESSKKKETEADSGPRGAAGGGNGGGGGGGKGFTMGGVKINFT